MVLRPQDGWRELGALNPKFKDGTMSEVLQGRQWKRSSGLQTSCFLFFSCCAAEWLTHSHTHTVSHTSAAVTRVMAADTLYCRAASLKQSPGLRMSDTLTVKSFFMALNKDTYPWEIYLQTFIHISVCLTSFLFDSVNFIRALARKR